MPKRTKDIIDYLTLYKFHGLKIKSTGSKDATANCIFCGSSDAFSIKLTTGQYQCWACEEKGNVYTFITKYHQQQLEATTKNQYLRLKKNRSGFIHTAFLNKCGLASSVNGMWLIPIHSPSTMHLSGNGSNGGSTQNLVNLRVWNPKTNILYNTPGMKSSIYVPFKVSSDGPILICEGEWDAIALSYFLQKAYGKDRGGYNVIAVPGANTFKKSWVEYFEGREVYLLYDNDKAGVRGMDKVVQTLGKIPSSVNRLVWPEGTDEKYDIRDWCKDHIKKEKLGYQFNVHIFDKCGVVEVKDDTPIEVYDDDQHLHVDAIECTSFNQLVRVFRKHLRIDRNFIDVLSVVVSIHISTKIAGDPVWFYIVGPASSGKTTQIDAFEAVLNTEHISKLTSTSLVSGYKGDGEDYSLLPNLRNKTLFIKDFTAVLSMSGTEKEELYGMLRDAYDGKVKVPRGNQKPQVYRDLYFSLVAGVTGKIHADNRSSLGERFMKIQLVDSSFDAEEHIRAGLSNVGKKKEFTTDLQAHIRGFVEHLENTCNFDDLPPFNKIVEEQLIALAQVCAMLRTKVERTSGQISYRPETEVGTRIAKILKKIAYSLCFTLGRKRVDQEIYRLLKKIALDTSIGFPLEIVQETIDEKSGLKIEDLAKACKLHENQVRHVVTDMQAIGSLVGEKKSNGTGRRGRQSYYYGVSPELKSLWKRAKLPLDEEKKVRRRKPSNKTKRRIKVI